MPENNWPRVILHADMDAFYASVEQLDNPELKGRPVIVGGTGPRGVVSAASYEARKFGVHSAQPSAIARRRCPDGVFLPVRMSRYREVSAEVFRQMREITPLVEGLSLDEAFLDVTGSLRVFGSPAAIGERLRDNIRTATGLNVSIGIAPNKFVAKIASDIEKPAGFVVVPPERVQDFLDPLPLKRLWGLGPKTLPKVEAAGFRTFRDIRSAPLERLRPLFGNQAERYRLLAAGEDRRPVQAEREDKSISAEETFTTDIESLQRMETELLALSEKVAARLRRAGHLAHNVTVKIRQPDFTTHTRSRSFSPPGNTTRDINTAAVALLRDWHAAHPGARIRLLGVAAREFSSARQIGLFDTGPAAGNEKVDRLVDALRERFGESAVRRGRLLDED